MVPCEVVSAGSRDSLELVVLEGPAEVPPGGGQSVMENIVGIVHPVDLENRLQTALVERAVVSDHGIDLQERFDLFPHLGEDRGILRVLGPQAVHLLAEPLVVLGLRMYERVEGIDDDVVPHDDDTHGTDARPLLVRGLEVQAVEIKQLTHIAGPSGLYRPVSHP